MPWHVVCMSMGLCGCPYLGPIIEDFPEDNLPEIKSWTDWPCDDGWEDLLDDPPDTDDPNLTTLCIPPDLTQIIVFVKVYNADDDMLDYLWYTDFKGRISSGELSGANNFVECDNLDPATIDNGDVLTFSVADRTGNEAYRSWTLVVY